MKIKKIISLIFAIFIFLGLIGINVSAVDNYEIEKVIEGVDGSIILRFTNIELDSSNTYEWGISKTSTEAGVENWYPLSNYNVNEKTAQVNLVSSDDNILSILKTTDTAYIYIKDITNSTNVVNGVEVDLTLPLTNVFRITGDSYIGNLYITQNGTNSGEAVYGITTSSFQFIKINNQNIINAYNTAKENDTDIYSIDLTAISSIPSTGWLNCGENISGDSTYIPDDDIPTEDGLYALWLRSGDADSKTVYGFVLYEVGVVETDTSAPTVTNITVQSPNEGSYGTGQKVRIRVYFSENITGGTVPTLTIRFGESEERELTNGVINNTTLTNYIEYSYTIQDSDEGQLMAVSMEGGNITDAAGNEVTLSTPAITGNAIIANRDIDINTGNNNDNNNNQNNNNNNGDDDTTAPGTLPQTGESILIISLIIGVTIVSVIGVIKFRKLKDIK